MPTVAEEEVMVRELAPIGLEDVTCRSDEPRSDLVEAGDIVFSTGTGPFDRLTMLMDGFWTHTGIVAGRLSDVHGDCEGGQQCAFANHPMPIAPIPDRDDDGKQLFHTVRHCKQVEGLQDRLVVVHQNAPGLVVWDLDFWVEWYQITAAMRPRDRDGAAAGQLAFDEWTRFPGEVLIGDDRVVSAGGDGEPECHSDHSLYSWSGLINSGMVAWRAKARDWALGVLRTDPPSVSREDFIQMLEKQEKVKPWDPDQPAPTSCAGFVFRKYVEVGGNQTMTPRFNRGIRVRNGRIYDQREVVTVESLLNGDLGRVMDSMDVDEEANQIADAWKNYGEASLDTSQVVHGPGYAELIKSSMGAFRQHLVRLPRGSLVVEAVSPNDLWHSPDAESRVILHGLELIGNDEKGEPLLRRLQETDKPLIKRVFDEDRPFPDEYREQFIEHEKSCSVHSQGAH